MRSGTKGTSGSSSGSSTPGCSADTAPVGGQPTVEVSHEALLRAWPRLRNWLKARSQFVQWRAQDLAPSLERWLDGNKNPEFLLPRSLLEPALQWLRDYPDELAGPPTGYIYASNRHRARRRRRDRVVVAVIVVASLVAAGVFYSLQQTANQQRDKANQQRDIAISAEVAAQSEQLVSTDPATAAFLAAAAWRIAHTHQAQESMLQLLAQPERAVLSDGIDPVAMVAFSPDGRVLAAGTGIYGGGAVLLWDLTTGRRIGEPITGKEDHDAYEVDFSPDGKTLATGSLDGAVRLWDVATQRPIGGPMLVGSYNNIAGLAFVPNGKIITGNRSGTIQLWDAAAQLPIGRPMLVNGGIDGLAVSANGKTLLTANRGQDQLWNLATRRPSAPPSGQAAAPPPAPTELSRARSAPMAISWRPWTIQARSGSGIRAPASRSAVPLPSPPPGMYRHHLRAGFQPGQGKSWRRLITTARHGCGSGHRAPGRHADTG